MNALDLAIHKARLFKNAPAALKKIEEPPSKWRYVTRKGLVEKPPEKKQVIRRLIGEPLFPPLTTDRAKRIVEDVAAQHNISAKDIYGPCRSKYIVTARWEAFCKVRNETAWGFSALGRFFKKDHTTILHALRRYGVGEGPHDTFWTDEKDDIIRRLYARRCKSREIAKELKTTRNAVLGRAYRLGIRMNRDL